MSERDTEQLLRNLLNECHYEGVEEQGTKDLVADQLLSTASKHGTGKKGPPEFVARIPGLDGVLVVVECKASTKDHGGGTTGRDVTTHNEWDMLDGWTGLYEPGQAQRIVARLTAEVEDRELVSFCSGIIEDLFLWAMNDEWSAMEGRKVLKEDGVWAPEALLTFPYDPDGLAGGELELWHSELRRNYLHWLIQNAVAAEMEGTSLPAWQVTGYAAVKEWMRN